MTTQHVVHARAPDELPATGADTARRQWFNLPSRRAQTAGTLAAFAVYALAFFLLYPLLGSAVTSLSVLPVIVVGWLLGMWPGLLAGVLCFALNLVLLNTAGQPGWEILIYTAGGAMGTALLLVLGAAAGRMGGLVRQVERGLSARQQAQDEIRRMALLLDAAPNAITVHDLDGRFLYTNQRNLDLHGFERDEFMALNLHQLDAPISEQLIDARMQELREHGEATFEVEHFRKDGSILPLEVNARVTAWEGRKVIISAATDITERKRTEDALKKSEALLSETGRMTNVGGWEYDVHTLELVWTADLYRIHEVDLTFKPTISNALDFYTTTSRPIIEQAVQRAVEQGEPFDVELEIITAKGNLRSVHSIGKADRERARIFGTFQDITERKRAEESLRESEDRYRRLVELLPDGVIVHSQGRVVFANPASRSIIGAASAAEMTGKPVIEFVHPDYRALALKRIQQSLSDGVPVPTAEEKFVRLDGTPIDVEVSATPFPYAGKPAMLTVFNDISERKRAEQALIDSEQQYRALVDAAHDIIFRIGLDASISSVNPAFEALTQWPPGEWIGQAFASLVHPDDLPRAFEAFGRVLAGETALAFESRIRTQAGTYLELEITGAPLWEHGAVAGAIGIGRNITERKQAESQLSEQLDELRRWHDATLGRETRILALKREVNEVLGQADRPPRYLSVET